MEHLILTSMPSAAIAAAWNDCLDGSDFATHYTAPEFFEEHYFKSRRPFAVLAVDRQVVHGIVSGLADDKTLSCGASGSPHVCVRRDADLVAVGQALASGLRHHSASARSPEFISAFSWMEVPGFQAAGFRATQFGPPLSTILLDLSKGADILFREFSETRRNKIRRAIKAHVEVQEMDLERDFEDYYTLYSDWCNFKRIPSQSHDMQRAVFSAKGNRLILVARHEGRIIGVSTFRYRRPGVMEYAANVSRRAETKVRQNDLLLWRAIEWAAQQGGFRYFSTAGAHFFLQKFGGHIQTTYRYSLDLTLFRRHDMKERLQQVAMRGFRKLPEGAKQALRNLLHRNNENE